MNEQVVSDDQLGPIDYLAVGFPAGRFTAEDFTMLLDAVNRRAVRVLDLEFVVKDADGTVAKVDLNELDNPAGVIWVYGKVPLQASSMRLTSPRSERRSSRIVWPGSSSTRTSGPFLWRRRWGATELA